MYSRGKQAIEWVRRTGKVKGLVFIVISLIGMAFLMIFMVEDAMAEDGGAFIGTGTVVVGSGDSEPGAPGCDKDYDNAVECRGVSWVFYEATGRAGAEGVDLTFPATYDKGENKITIPKECSLEGRGFWHFGRTAIARHYNKHGYNFAYFSDFNRVLSYELINFAERKKSSGYSTFLGKYGHMKTYNWGFQRYATKYQTGSFTHPNGNGGLQNELYKINSKKDYKKIYKATKYGHIGGSRNGKIDAYDLNLNESNPEVWRHFKTAWKYATRTEYAGTNFPNNLKFFCYWKEMEEVTLVGQSVRESDGKKLVWSNSNTVETGNTASVTAPKKTNSNTGGEYGFMYWQNEAGDKVEVVCPREEGSKHYACLDPNNNRKLTIEEMQRDREFSAVYGRRTMRAAAKDISSGNALNWPASFVKTLTVPYGYTAGLVAPSTITSGGRIYKFLYWENEGGNEVVASCPRPDGNTTYACIDKNNNKMISISTLKNDREFYAIYVPQDIRLVGKSVNQNGDSLASVAGLVDKIAIVDYFSLAKVTRGTATGYTFRGWAESLDNAKNGLFVTRESGATYVSGSSSPKETYNVSSMTDSSITPVYARYDRNEFSGRVRAFEGASTNGTNSTNTGWVETNTDSSLSIPCVNDGCRTTFDLYLRTITGTGKTYYSVSRSKNNGSFSSVSVLPASPLAPSVNGAAIRKAIGNFTETLKPGEKVCYRLTFRPYGRYSDTVTTSVTVCVTAKTSVYEGKSSVTGATNGTTDWQRIDKTDTFFVYGCLSTVGCSVSFNHRIRAVEEGGGSTNYIIARTSNLTETVRKIENNPNVKSGRFSGGESEVGTSGPFTLYPGMVVCETLTFRVRNASAGNATTKICASALGKAQPDDPNDPNDPDYPEDDPNGNDGSNALVDIEVRNNSVTKYNTYRRIIYGKPGDSLTYRASYNPNLQYTYYLKPEQMRVDGGTIYPSATGVNTTRSLATMFNAVKTPGWNNDIHVYSVNFVGSAFSRAYDYPNGQFLKRTETNGHNVVAGEVGRSLNEYAEINYSRNETVKTTPTQVRFTTNGTRNLGNVSTSRRYKVAYARIPYNYTTDIEVPEPEGPNHPGNNSPAPEIVYAGEDKQISIKVDVLPKNNNTTMNPGDSPYATKTGRSTVKVIVYVTDDPKGGTSSYAGDRNSDLCAYYGTTADKSGDSWDCGSYTAKESSLNNVGNLNGETTTFPTTFNAPDVDAGKKICVAAAIFPANSGLDTNYSSLDGGRIWRISDSRCFVVAKRPSLQVVGGGLYSVGNLVTSVAAKRNVFGFYPVLLSSRANTTIFGSWVEHQIVAVGNTAGISSGASTGYFGSSSSTVPASGRTPKVGLGGSFEGTRVDYCIRVPLTMANTNSAIPCKGRSIAGGYISKSNATLPSDKEKLIAKYMEENEDVTIEHNKINGNHVISAMTVPKGLTRIIHATSNITIAGNIVYADGYSSLGEIPKLIIYAEGNVDISCNVTRIDAVIIAGRGSGNGVVNTCPTSFSNYTGNVTSAINWEHNYVTLINTRANSNPLRINGVIIANRLIANRTYGAAKGVNSVVPAEVINFDTTLYGWGMDKSEASASGKLRTVYQHELAPRY